MSKLPARQCLLVEASITVESRLRAQLADWSADDFIWLSDVDSDMTVAQRQARRYLGQAYPLVVFDASRQFSADALGAVIGTVKAGGLLVIIWPAKSDTPAQRRFRQIFDEFRHRQPDCFRLVNDPAIDPARTAASLPLLPFELNAGQDYALTRMLQQWANVSPKPLVLHADRGRGKSALLGVAAAKVWQQQSCRMIVTAPARTCVNALFEHARLHTPELPVDQNPLIPASRGLMFMAPDALLQHQPMTDLLLVDEAAGIPVFMLTAMLEKYPKSVFSSTLHGYEGSGRGFKLQFHKQLDRITPGWKALTLEQPTRWAPNDPLEDFSFRALLLDAEPPALTIDSVDTSSLEIITLTVEQLLTDEGLLRSVFGLLVSAHYRTRPSDLQRLLDDRSVRLDVAFYRQQPVAVCWSCREGPLANALAEAVFRGERRPPGQLLPQTLLAHAGLVGAGAFHYQRIVRMAVHPQLQRQGIGTALLDYLTKSLSPEVDMLGCNFATSHEVLVFWQSSEFTLAALGLRPDHISGRLALTCLKPLSEVAQQFIAQAALKLYQRRHAIEILLDGQLPAFLRRNLAIKPVHDDIKPLDVKPEVEAFAFYQRHFDNSRLALTQWMAEIPEKILEKSLSDDDQDLLIAAGRDLQPVSELVRRFRVAGRKACYQQLRNIVRQLLSD